MVPVNHAGFAAIFDIHRVDRVDPCASGTNHTSWNCESPNEARSSSKKFSCVGGFLYNGPRFQLLSGDEWLGCLKPGAMEVQKNHQDIKTLLLVGGILKL